MKKINKTVLAVILGYLTFIVFSSALKAVDISEYTPGDLTNIGSYTDLSGGTWVELLDGQSGPAYVDNFSGVITHLGVNCAVGGDLEGIVQKEIGQVYTVNEAQDGIALTDLASCSTSHRFRIEGFAPTQNDGMEGIEYKNGIIYILDENSGDIYTVIDNGSKSVVSTFLFNVDCGLDSSNRKNDASDLLFNGDNLVVICDSNVVAIEYTLDGNFVSQLSYSGLTNAEVGYFDDSGNLWIGGEPNQLVMFTVDGNVIIDPPPPVDVFESCTFSGNVEVNVNTGTFDAQTVTFECPTVIAEGTLN